MDKFIWVSTQEIVEMNSRELKSVKVPANWEWDIVNRSGLLLDPFDFDDLSHFTEYACDTLGVSRLDLIYRSECPLYDNFVQESHVDETLWLIVGTDDWEARLQYINERNIPIYQLDEMWDGLYRGQFDSWEEFALTTYDIDPQIVQFLDIQSLVQHLKNHFFKVENNFFYK